MFAAPLVVNAAPTAQAVARAGTWHTATNVPGLRALNKGGRARLNSVSCGAAGDCAAGGSYRDNHLRTRAFVISLTNGTWDPAVEVPGLATLNAGGNASADSVSCVSAGNCTAVGDYTDGFGHPQPVAVREKNGIWGQAIQLPGPGLFDADAGANVISVSCASAGTLRHWRVLHRRLQARAGVRSERGERCLAQRGRGARIRHPERRGCQCHLGVVPLGGICAVGGTYTDGSGHTQAFVVNQA